MTAQKNDHTPYVSVTGEGIVKVMPDQVIIRVRVENEGSSATEVKAANDSAIDAVLKYCNQKKIANKDIQTEYIRLNKNYDYNKKIYKYNANQSLSIKLRKLSDYESLMQGLLDSGINRIDGVNFKSSKMDVYLSDARKKAVENAKKKAMEYAGVLGQSVGKAISISETNYNAPSPVDFRNKAELRSMAASDGAAETISVGEMLITAKVNITFILN
ncbi:SIMPL domain-containing protein [Spongiivirga sp. MCCC 1A20706]|uniref:SIMPL domain-containing protein n=1 Tax=Spongiivirga sp. MCCC 1A20706 TaxID=3160963 RepID=UPI003977423D